MSEYSELFVDTFNNPDTAFYIGTQGQAIFVNPPTGPNGRNGVNGVNGVNGIIGSGGIDGKSFVPDAPSVSYFGTMPEIGIDLTIPPVVLGSIVNLPITYNLSHPPPAFPPPAFPWNIGNGTILYTGPTIFVEASFSITPISRRSIVEACMTKTPSGGNIEVVPGTHIYNQILEHDRITHQISAGTIMQLDNGDQIGISARAKASPATGPPNKSPEGESYLRSTEYGNLTFKCLSGKLV